MDFHSFRITFWNTLSASILGIIIYPIIQLILTGHYLYIIMIVGILVTDLTTRFLKWISKTESSSTPAFLRRPVDATDCNILCTNGAQGGKSGMPSGHMALVLFFITFVYMMQIHSLSSIIHKFIFILFSIIYLSLMGYDRFRRKCHTFLQVLSGSALGTIIGYIIALVFKSKL